MKEIIRYKGVMMEGMIKYRCPKCGYTMAAAMVIGGAPTCPKDGTKLEKVA